MRHVKTSTKILGVAGVAVGVFWLAMITVIAADGSGTVSVSPTSVSAGSAANTLTFTFTPAETMDSGGITIAVPSDWSAPQNSAGSAGYTTVSSASGVVGNVEDNMDSLTGWSAQSGACNAGLSIDTTVVKEGTGTVYCQNSGATNNTSFYHNITSENWTGYTNIAFWIRTSANLSSSQLKFLYDDTANLASPIQSLNLPAITANTWTYVVLAFGANVRTSVVSFGFQIAGASAQTNNIRVDDLLLGPGSPSFPGGGVVSVRFLQLASGQTVVTTYGSGGGASGATVPTTGTSANFLTKSRTSSSGALTSLAAQPVVTILGGIPTAEDLRNRNTLLRFWGKAYPEARIYLVEKSFFSDKLITVTSEADALGNFLIEKSGVRSGSYAYSLLIEDKEGRQTQTKVYETDATNLLDKYIFASPTLDFAEASVERGAPLHIMGYATPGKNVIVEVGESVYKTIAANDGRYQLTAETGQLALGIHGVRAKQQDDTTHEESEYSLIRNFNIMKIPVYIDFNGDGRKDISDWSIFLATWSKTGEERKVIDLNKDGAVDISDLSLFLDAFHASNNGSL